MSRKRGQIFGIDKLDGGEECREKIGTGSLCLPVKILLYILKTHNSRKN